MQFKHRTCLIGWRGGYRGTLFHSVYVDEVQDLSPAQIALLTPVCPNKDRFILAGDTAQTIAHGVGFRFQDVQRMFYEEFLGRAVQVDIS